MIHKNNSVWLEYFQSKINTERNADAFLVAGPTLKPGASPRGGHVRLSTSLLPEAVPEIDANLLSFYGDGGEEVGQV